MNKVNDIALLSQIWANIIGLIQGQHDEKYRLKYIFINFSVQLSKATYN